MFAWDVRVEPSSGPPVTFRHSTLRGMLLAREDLARTNPAHRPVLTRSGVARLTVLRLCDGDRTLAEIEGAVYDGTATFLRHPSKPPCLWRRSSRGKQIAMLKLSAEC